MSPDRLKALLATYRGGLLDDTLPFWIPRAIDREYGGYLTALDQDGSLLQSDKSVWVQGRFAWLLATLFDTVERRAEWLDLSRHGIEFINRHCFDADGRMFFSVTREGRPLRKRRYLFSEAFAVIALAAFGRAAGDARAKAQALDLFRLLLKYHREPGLLEPKVIPATRRTKGLAMPMILIVTAQELRKSVDDPICTQVIDECIAEIERDFLEPDLRCVLESVGPNGEFHRHLRRPDGLSRPCDRSGMVHPRGSATAAMGTRTRRGSSSSARRSSAGRWPWDGIRNTAASSISLTPAGCRAPNTPTT